MLLDGKPPVAPVLEHEPGADVRPQTEFDGYAYETYVGAAYQIGWPRLTKGRHTLTFVCVGKSAASSGYNARRGRHRPGEDGRRGLGRGRRREGAARRRGQRRRPRAGAVGPGPRRRADSPRWPSGTRARRRCRRLPQLEKALKDPDPNVRMMAGNAIAAIGKDAAPAVPRSSPACSVKDEQIHVLRACASALGAIGKPAATPALPVLRKLAEHPRIRWAAEAAIKKIQ